MVTKLDVSYVCPDCRSYLLLFGSITLIVKPCTNEKKGLLLIDPAMGKYEIIGNSRLDLTSMDCFDYYCPSCGSNLAATNTKKNMARIIVIDIDEKEYDLFFSRYFDEHSTFKVVEGDSA